MDKVFKQEEKHLAETESVINRNLTHCEKQAQRLAQEIADFVTIDYEDIDQKKAMQASKDDYYEKANQWRAKVSEPYFGRIDLEIEVGDRVETQTAYIGKEGIADGSNVIVSDWRSPMGMCFSNKNQKEYEIHGQKYQLALRRGLIVKNAKLISYHTEFDAADVSLQGELIDPFLLEVLRDKRRQKRLTDIIRTIQGNQNEMIRRPKDESFVVQGCAGSGKTMIMLHRLSYLKFNNRSMPLDGVKIITPNKFFDAHIDDLSRELDLTSIQRFSVEEYYAHLMKKYSGKLAPEPKVHSEKLLNTALLEELYSLSYLESSAAHYHDYWMQVLKLLDEARLRSVFEKFQMKYPDTTAHTAATATALEQVLRSMSSTISATEIKRKDAEQRLENLSAAIRTAKSDLEKAQNQCDSTKANTVLRLESEAVKQKAAIGQKEQRIEELKEQTEVLRQRFEEVETALQQEENNLHMGDRPVEAYTDYEQFVLKDDDVTRILRKEFAALLQQLDETEQALKKVPFYNFTRRGTYRRQLAELKEQFAGKAAEFIAEKRTAVEQSEKALRETLGNLKRELSDAESELQKKENDLRNWKTMQMDMLTCVETLNSTVLPDTRTMLPSRTHSNCEKYLKAYEEHRISVLRNFNKLASLEQTKTEVESEYAKLMQTNYTDKDSAFIESCVPAVKKLQLSEITRAVLFRDLMDCYRRHGQEYRKINYRHKLYLRLLFCALYFARQMNPDNFLNIDEAQDLSVSEYRVLRMVLGERCVFNLYGDINQSVYSYKGISEWEELSDITAGHIYQLNENYRNTIQITEFCNREFEAEIYPIGIKGAPVAELCLAEAVKWITDLKQSEPERRVAILHRHGVKAIREQLAGLLRNQSVSWYAVDDERISVLSVEAAKGLEFEAVVAVVDQMSINETYISYTRALEQLAVVRDRFPKELDVDEDEDALDEE